MSAYKFIDSNETLIKKDFNSFDNAKHYAKQNNLFCLTMDYQCFINAFNAKINKFRFKHVKFDWLRQKANDAMLSNCGSGYQAIQANDFMRRIIELPTVYIMDWLDGKNDLEWLPEYKV